MNDEELRKWRNEALRAYDLDDLDDLIKELEIFCHRFKTIVAMACVFSGCVNIAMLMMLISLCLKS